PARPRAASPWAAVTMVAPSPTGVRDRSELDGGAALAPLDLARDLGVEGVKARLGGPGRRAGEQGAGVAELAVVDRNDGGAVTHGPVDERARLAGLEQELLIARHRGVGEG